MSRIKQHRIAEENSSQNEGIYKCGSYVSYVCHVRAINEN